MEITLLLGYLAAILIGISLGLIGGGGSILTVPVLVYLLGVEAVTSTSYSLFIVGATALVGGIRAFLRSDVEVKIGIIFAVPSLLAVWLTRAYLIPSIPNVLYSGDLVVLTKDLGIMILFAIIMLLSSYSMIRSKNTVSGQEGKARTIKDDLLILIEGLVVGAVTGIVGAGGGFLIIPALVLLAKIPMKKAVGTSLMIIAIKSLIGFTGDLSNPDIAMDWMVLVVFTILSIVGIYIGAALSKRVSGPQLKKGFGWFLLVMGIYILIERITGMLV